MVQWIRLIRLVDYCIFSGLRLLKCFPLFIAFFLQVAFYVEADHFGTRIYVFQNQIQRHALLLLAVQSVSQLHKFCV